MMVYGCPNVPIRAARLRSTICWRADSDVVQQWPRIGQLQAGTVRALAVTTATRAPFLPDVPSMSETVPGYDTGVWWGLLGPANLPPDVLTKLSHDFVAALNTDAVKERLGKLGALPIGSSPPQFDARIRADYEKWGPIIKAAGMKAE
jgi:tripartite-type tricarboxylate transporter receptor subunit TctC